MTGLHQGVEQLECDMRLVVHLFLLLNWKVVSCL